MFWGLGGFRRVFFTRVSGALGGLGGFRRV